MLTYKCLCGFDPAATGFQSRLSAGLAFLECMWRLSVGVGEKCHSEIEHRLRWTVLFED